MHGAVTHSAVLNNVDSHDGRREYLSMACMYTLVPSNLPL